MSKNTTKMKNGIDQYYYSRLSQEIAFVFLRDLESLRRKIRRLFGRGVVDDEGKEDALIILGSAYEGIPLAVQVTTHLIKNGVYDHYRKVGFAFNREKYSEVAASRWVGMKPCSDNNTTILLVGNNFNSDENEKVLEMFKESFCQDCKFKTDKVITSRFKKHLSGGGINCGGSQVYRMGWSYPEIVKSKIKE